MRVGNEIHPTDDSFASTVVCMPRARTDPNERRKQLTIAPGHTLLYPGRQTRTQVRRCASSCSSSSPLLEGLLHLSSVQLSEVIKYIAKLWPPLTVNWCRRGLEGGENPPETCSHVTRILSGVLPWCRIGGRIYPEPRKWHYQFGTIDSSVFCVYVCTTFKERKLLLSTSSRTSASSSAGSYHYDEKMVLIFWNVELNETIFTTAASNDCVLFAHDCS